MKFAYRVIILIIAFLVTAMPVVDAKDSRTVRKQRETAKKQLSTASKKLRKNEEQVLSRLNQLNLVEAEIARHESNIKKARQLYDVYTAQAKLLNDSIEDADRRLAKMKDAYGAAVRHMQRNGSETNQLMFVFSADDFHQGLQRYRYLKQFSKWRENQSQEIEGLKEQIFQKKTRLDSAARRADFALQSLNKSLAGVESKKNEQTKVIARLKKDGKTLKSVIKTQQRKLRELDNELERLIKEEEKRAREAEAKRRKATETNSDASNVRVEDKTPAVAPVKDSASSAVENLSGSFASNKGNLPMPVTGKASIVKHFGRQRHDQLKNVETNNGGIDIETTHDSKARVVFDGKISGVFQTADFNNVVMVRHGEYLTIYVNIASVKVKSGQAVKAGDIIGSIYSDPNDDNRTILHFEIRKEIEKLNPELWLKQ